MLDIRCGVPQCSILGRLSYIIYVSAIHMACQNNIFSVVDDTISVYRINAEIKKTLSLVLCK